MILLLLCKFFFLFVFVCFFVVLVIVLCVVADYLVEDYDTSSSL